MLGRIASGKNLPRAVSILAACRAKGLKARLHIVGPVDERFRDGWTDLCRRIQADGLPVGVEGVTAHPLRHMRRSSLMLLTSNQEGLPGAVLESLACGTPVVASALPGVMEIAARVRGIVPVDVWADDQKWVDAIDVALGIPREDIKASFAVGPFQFGRYVDDMLEAWGQGATT
jgi:glycosyltransferase involved in cell wall biosynthesis